MPLITIGLPSHNSERTLELTLKSIFAQSMQDWELICIDDGSTDGTRQILDSLKDPRVHVTLDDQNLGLAARLNQIATQAKGEFLARMDADDIMFPVRLEKQLQFIKSNPDVDLLGTGMVCIDNSEVPRGIRRAPQTVCTPFRILKGEVIYHPTLMARTTWFREHQFDENFGRSEDFELWARTANGLRIANLQEPLLFYREYGMISWRKYWLYSQQTKRAILRHGPSSVGSAKTLWLLLRRLFRDLAYGAAALSGQMYQAIDMRNTSLSVQDAQAYRNILESIPRDG